MRVPVSCASAPTKLTTLRARFWYACTASPRPSQPARSGSRRTRANNSSDSSRRSASSASIVMPICCNFASRASEITAGTSSASTRARCGYSYRGCSADSLTEIDGRANTDSSDARADAPITAIASRYDARYRAASAAVTAASPSMSYECRYAFCSAVPLRATASLIVRPSTNCSAITFIAWRTATRTTGSPARAAKRPYHARGSRASSRSMRVSLPVSISPHVDALTRSESDAPRCRSQSPRDSLSRISASAVAASGIRSNASATHISSTPSGVERSYCCRNDSMPPCDCRSLRTASTHARACAAIARVSASVCVSWAASATSTARSSARNAARIAAPSGVSGSSGIVSSAVSMGGTGFILADDGRRAVASIARAPRACRWSSS